MVTRCGGVVRAEEQDDVVVEGKQEKEWGQEDREEDRDEEEGQGIGAQEEPVAMPQVGA